MASESSTILGENVARLRADRGLSQQRLADLCDVARPRIAEIESGRYNPTVDTVDRIAKALGVSTATLFRRPQTAA